MKIQNNCCAISTTATSSKGAIIADLKSKVEVVVISNIINTLFLTPDIVKSTEGYALLTLPENITKLALARFVFNGH